MGIAREPDAILCAVHVARARQPATRRRGDVVRGRDGSRGPQSHGRRNRCRPFRSLTDWVCERLNSQMKGIRRTATGFQVFARVNGKFKSRRFPADTTETKLIDARERLRAEELSVRRKK